MKDNEVFLFIIAMRNDIKKQIPQWAFNINNNDKLILTDDLDSLFGCVLLNHLFGCEVGYFYDFKTLHATGKHGSNFIGVDLATEKGRTFDNHVVRLNEWDKVNLDSVNLNVMHNISRTNYFDKFGGSTTLTIASLYDVFDWSTMTDTQLMILACIDSYYLGEYSKFGKVDEFGYSQSQHAFIKYQNQLELDEFNRLFWNIKQDEFDSFKKHVDGKLSIKNGKINSTIDIEFLKLHFPMLNWDILNGLDFKLKRHFKESKYITQIGHGVQRDELTNNQLFSMAVTGTNKVKYTSL